MLQECTKLFGQDTSRNGLRTSCDPILRSAPRLSQCAAPSAPRKPGLRERSQTLLTAVLKPLTKPKPPVEAPRPWHVADELLAATMDIIEAILPDRGDATIPAARDLKRAVHAQDIDSEPNKLKLREAVDVLEYVISKVKGLV